MLLQLKHKFVFNTLPNFVHIMYESKILAYIIIFGMRRCLKTSMEYELFQYVHQFFFFFADNSLCLQGISGTCLAVLDMLKTCDDASSQCINLAKLAIALRKAVSKTPSFYSIPCGYLQEVVQVKIYEWKRC